ncbi:MAG: type II toxin-antitoxin system RelE/ParE family toxin [Azoarcus sp.]|nr:type II toxin-antitoxin system RelE/ParE family toxin [Azoarcus sp.]
MYSIKPIPEFTAWFDALEDRQIKQRLSARMRKMSMGIFGDVKPVGEGVSEAREHFGAGWRLYFIQRGSVLIVMLAGGTKRTQDADINRAKKLAARLED